MSVGSAEGLTKGEINRCLSRYIAREIHANFRREETNSTQLTKPY